ncbi:hypothetical protein [Coralloluteibacterium thermophilus]|uniref:DUF2868 domain-containing protein n=1 Tax=Coralloluteibacterium thermophilum TaxID=2707049 RepID=A0ABV9NG56_9GAMM
MKRLRFVDLDAKLAALAARQGGAASPRAASKRWEAHFLLTAAVGVAIALIGAQLLSGTLGLTVALLGIAVEFAGVLGFGTVVLRQEIPKLRRPREDFARGLDADRAEFERLVAWLRAFPADEIARSLRYLRVRQDSLHQRTGLLTGGVERLGVLPILIALYLQFKDWRFGDWQALGDITLVGGILAMFVLMMFALGYLAVALRVRLDLMVYLLTEAATAAGTSPHVEDSEAHADR